MSDISPRRRLFGRALIGASALALPMTASFTYAAAQAQDNDAPPLPAPPAVAAPPAPPAPEAGERREQRLVLRHPDAAPRERREVRRYVFRDRDGARSVRGAPHVEFRGYDFSNDPEARKRWEEWSRQMDDWSKRYGKQMRQWGEQFGRQMREQMRTERFAFRAAPVPAPPAAPQPPQAPAVPLAPRTSPQAWAAPHVVVTPEMLAHCRSGENDASETTSPDGRRQVVICNRVAAGRGQALSSLRATRERIASNNALSEDIRRDVLHDLDQEIERLQHDGGDQH